MEIVETILLKMYSVTTPQRKFMLTLLCLLMRLRGRANFRNLSRYSHYNEKTYSRWYRQYFDFLGFNQIALSPLADQGDESIAATDASFIPKSGEHTDGLGKFYSSTHGKAEKGLEISTLAIISVTENTAYNLSTRQTPAVNDDDKTRVDF
jgi:hypothetical protein